MRLHDWAIKVQEVRELALSLPETIEQVHFGNPSFRVRGKIFATLPDSRHVNVMIDPFNVDAAIRAAPESCEELWWGKELRGVRVSLRDADPRMLDELLREAWRRKAPKRLSS